MSMTYEQQEDRMLEHLKTALRHMNVALQESTLMCNKYGQQEYGRNEYILEARQALENIINNPKGQHK